MEQQIIKCGFKTIFCKELPPSSLKKGRNLNDSKHVFNVIENKTSITDIITASVLRQTSINQPPYKVEIHLNAERIIEHCICECPAGSGGRCKHISAVFCHVNDAPVHSKTDKPCEWTKPSTFSKQQYSKEKTFAELFPKKRDRKIDSKLSDVFSILDTEIKCDLKTILKEEIKTEGERFIYLYINELLNTVFDSITKKSIESTLHYIMGDDNVVKDVDIKYNLTVEQKAFYNNYVNLSLPDLKKKYIDTTVQSACKSWHDERRIRISASTKAHQIKTLTRKEPSRLAEEFLNPKKLLGKAAANVSYGMENEAKAKSLYKETYHTDILDCGLIICPEYPWLCASPDGIIVNNYEGNINKPNYVLEIKCPSSAKNEIVETNNNTTKLQYLKWNEANKKFELKKSHQYYTQCQVLLFVTKLEKLHFFIYSRKPLNIEVDRDDSFLQYLLPKLETFYFTEYLPLLVKSDR